MIRSSSYHESGTIFGSRSPHCRTSHPPETPLLTPLPLREATSGALARLLRPVVLVAALQGRHAASLHPRHELLGGQRRRPVAPSCGLHLAVRTHHDGPFACFGNQAGNHLVSAFALPGIADPDPAGIFGSAGGAAALAPVEDHRDAMVLRPLISPQFPQ